MNRPITASMLYNFVQCPHRVAMDLFGDRARRDPVSRFVQLLWEKGITFEQQVIESFDLPFVDLSGLTTAEKEACTLEALKRGDGLIYGGRICADDLIGEPDLLCRQGNGYVAVDIKSGAALEGAGENAAGKPKKHYAVQLALYTDILERIQMSAGRDPLIWDIHLEKTSYPLHAQQGDRRPETLWDFYRKTLETVRKIAAKEAKTLPALSSICKLCHWRSVCTAKIEKIDDLTLIPELGRSRRDAIRPYIGSVTQLAKIDLKRLIQVERIKIPHVSFDMLATFQARAKLQIEPNATPYLKSEIEFPKEPLEIFFDVETDPMRDICYLHGFVERRNRNLKTEKYIFFFANEPTPTEEKKTFAEALNYLRAGGPCAIYYYSPYEKMIYRRLQQKYPDIATEDEIEALFSKETTIDLYYDVVKTKTEWPTRDYSIKTLAKYLGFRWRDPEPSGAASIEWYHRWVETGDASIRQRILDYNEDDCLATRILLDALRDLHLKKNE